MLERDVLPTRVDGYRPAMLDELCAAGELVWIGAGALGADDGRVRLFFRDRVKLLASSVVPPEPPSGPLHDTIREHLARAGASFWPDLVTAAGTADEAVLLTALWDLVWAGEVTNDTFGPLRVPRRAGARRSTRARPHPGRLARLGPPAGAGRWSLVAPLIASGPTPTEVAHAIALQLLERHGVVTREAVRAEGTPGGFAGVYPVLRALEEAGRARRGWFVAGLGAAQFALPGAVDRLRAHRVPVADEPARVVVLAATDPAQPYGAALELARARRRRPAHAHGRRARRADRRRVRHLRRARRPRAPDLRGGPRRRAGRRRLGRRAGRGPQGRPARPAPDRAHRRRARAHLAARAAAARGRLRRRIQGSDAAQVAGKARSVPVPGSGGLRWVFSTR